MAYGCQAKTVNQKPKKPLHPLEFALIMRVCKKAFVSGYTGYRGKKRSMWNVKQGSGHEKTDCCQQSVFS
jgi:hypothetical protein